MRCGFVDGMKRIVAESGVGGLYKGVVPTIAKQASNQVLLRATLVFLCSDTAPYS